MFSLEKGNADYSSSFIICHKLNFTVCILILLVQLRIASDQTKRIQNCSKDSFLQNVLKLLLSKKHFM